MFAPPLFLDLLGNVFAWVWFVIFALIGVFLGIVIRMYVLQPKNQMLYIRERDGRGNELNIKSEDAISLVTNSNPVMRFFKWGRSYEIRKRGKSSARFFGKEGTAYTWRLEGFSKTPTKYKKVPVQVPVMDQKTGEQLIAEDGTPVYETKELEVPCEWENKKIELPFETLEDAVRFRWGEEYDSGVPERLQVMLRDDRIFVTVGLEAGIVPKGYTPITESVIEDKADEEMALKFAEAEKKSRKQDMFERIAWIGTGIAIAFALQVFGVI